MNASIFNNGKKQILLGSLKNTSEVRIDENSSVSYPVNMNLNNMNIGKTLFSKLIHLDNTFYLTGIADIKIGKYDFSVPFNKNIRINPPLF